MKIDLESIDKEQFTVHESEIYGEKLYLVQPQHIGCKWTQENKVFRSSVWNAEGELVSAGLPKFVNWGEAPEVFPTPKSIKGCTAVEKIDGSLLIVSKYKGQLILRTRGTFDASVHDNGNELEYIKNSIISTGVGTTSKTETWDESYLFEWVTPANRIILNYGDTPMFYLVGLVEHHTYELHPQCYLDELADCNDWLRPQTHTFNSIEDLISNVEQWKGKEGICLYSNNDQTIHKIKGYWYLSLHRLKSEISSVDKLLDVYLSWNMPSYEEFQSKITEIFDHELFIQVQNDVTKICEAKKEAGKELYQIKHIVDKFKDSPRKDAALAIIGLYGETINKGIAFTLLNGKDIDNKAWKQLILKNL